MKIKKMNVNELQPAVYNPRIALQPDDIEYQKLKKSIERFGLVDPIIFNEKTGNVVGGHQRLTVIKDMGFEEIDVSIIDISEKEEKALNVALNKISGDWDNDKLAQLLESLDEEHQDLTGFDQDEIDTLLDEVDIDSLFEEKEEKNDNKNNDDGDKEIDVAVDLINRLNEECLQNIQNYKKSELHMAVGYFLEPFND